MGFANQATVAGGKCPFMGAASPQPMVNTPGPSQVIEAQTDSNALAFLTKLTQEFGNTVRYQTRYGPSYLFTQPEHIQTILHSENFRRVSLLKMVLGNGLITSEGAHWKSVRRLMQPSFQPAAVAPFASIVSSEAGKVAIAWEKASRSGEVINVTAAMTHLTLRVIIQALFSDDLPDERYAEICDAVTENIDQLGKVLGTMFGAPMHFTPEFSARISAAKKVIDDLCHEMIQRRRAMPVSQRPPDLLTKLIEGETDTGPTSDAELRDEIVTMLVSGHETTANGLVWTWKALNDNPEVAEKMHRELDAAPFDRSIDAAEAKKLSWTTAVFQEAIRVYPPVWYLPRVATADDNVGGHAVPRGACLILSPWLTHRLTTYWPDPERFDPSRFINTSGPVASHRYAYFPFGGGRHMCIGMHVSMLESIITLATLARQFRVCCTNSGEVLPDPGITLRQTPHLLARIEARKALPIQWQSILPGAA